MSNSTQFNHFQRIRLETDTRLLGIIYREGTFNEFINATRSIRELDSFKKLTIQNQCSINGYIDGIYRVIECSLLEWRLYNREGELVSNKDSQKFDYSVCKEREEKGLDIGEHCWKGANGTKIWNKKE